MKKDVREAMGSSASAEWITPMWLLGLVSEVMDGIFLDPCAATEQPGGVGAPHFFTKEDDGLGRSWLGFSAFMNPPYGRGIDQWVLKLADSIACRGLDHGIALLPARFDTRWWRLLWEFDLDPTVLILSQRVRFLRYVRDEDGQLRVLQGDTAMFPSALVYYGVQSQRFLKVFGERGSTYRRGGAW